MAKNSPIEWTHHTFNPWWGCEKISPACAHCYAEAWAKRVGKQVWGKEANRRFFGEEHWRQPLVWNRNASAMGLRQRVFCASMADIFEERPDLDLFRERLWRTIEDTPALDWLLLTKRPEQVRRMVPWSYDWPRNVWLGTTVENQTWAQRRLSALVAQPAKIHFLSCEPLLGPVNLRSWMPYIDWVIAGGESGPRSRPMHPIWAQGLRDQCVEAGVPFHFKQWGDWKPTNSHAVNRRTISIAHSGDRITLERIGKLKAGRMLDGRTWDELPIHRNKKFLMREEYVR